MRPVALFFIALLLHAGQITAVDDPKALLLEVRKQVMSTITRLPKYLCTETVSREMRSPATPLDHGSCDNLAARRNTPRWKLNLIASDRLRLDVAVSGDSEMYSWVGEQRFEDRALADLVGGGATSTGAFAAYLGSIFGSNDARFTYLRGSQAANEGLAQFGFTMPLEKSHLSVGNRQHHGVVAYEGSFLVDTRTLSLVHLTVHAIGLPAELGVCEDTTTLDYENMNMNGSQFLLPKHGEFSVVSVNGNELVNKMSFSACREFHGESALHFDSSVGTNQTASIGSSPDFKTVPSGLPFTLALTESINPTTAAAGDVVTAKLTTAIRDKRKAVLAVRNTVVLGRIVQVEKLYGVYGKGIQSLRVGIKLESIEAGGKPNPFAARLVSFEKRKINANREMNERQAAVSPGQLVRREDLGSFDQMMGSRDATVGYLLYEDVTNEFIIRAGTRLEGTTASAELP